ncbi:MAG: sugar ABC transporter permease, partial [Spirochaetia bacterium]|nr:sugar ABC transporter permease [Spirochaetia bacterium]
MSKKISLLKRIEERWFWFFVSPWLLGFLVFTLGPMTSSLIMSFTNWDIFTQAQYVGMQNYTDLF